MRRYLKNSLIFLLPIFAVTLAFEIYLRSFDTEYKQKAHGLEQKADDLEVLILGNSHGYNGINPEEFDLTAYNMAGGNQSLYFDRRITEKYIEILPNLKYVLISVDFHSLYFSSTGIRDTWLYYGYGINYGGKSQFKNSISYFWFGYTPRIAISLIKDKLKKYFTGEFDKELIDGWSPSEGSNVAAFKPKNIRYKANWFNEVVLGSAERKSILKDLDDFIIFLQKQGIHPVFYTLPMRKEIYPLLDNNVRSLNSKDVSRLSKKYNVPYFDFTSATFIEDTDFYNEDHLNRKGANKISEELNKLLLKLESNP